MNALDRLIAAISPRMAVQRAAARQVLNAYEAARPSRTHKATRSVGAADNLLQGAARSLREQARHLDENHDIVIGILDRLEERIVGGAGIGVEPQPRNHDGSINRELAAELARRFASWSLKASVCGELTRPQMERMAARSWLRDGEVFGQLIEGKIDSLTYPNPAGTHFAIELLEADYCPLELTEGSISQGIERNAWRQPIAYHLYKQHPADWRGFSLSTKRVPAHKMLHLKLANRIGQGRGMTLLHGVITRLADIKDYEESERVAARISAALALYIKKGDASMFDGDNAQERQISFAPGTVIDDLQPGEEIGTLESNRPNPHLEGFRDGQLRAVSAGTRSSFSSTARNYNGTYSAQRQELVENFEATRVLQDEFIADWSRPVYRRWLAMELLNGLKLPKELNTATLFDAVYQPPVMPWIDPKKEADSYEKLMLAGVATEAEVIRARGKNPREVKAQRAKEIQENREQGLVFTSDAYHQYYGAQHANQTADATAGKHQTPEQSQ